MAQVRKVTEAGNSKTVTLSQEILDHLGVRVGDYVSMKRVKDYVELRKVEL